MFTYTPVIKELLSRLPENHRETFDAKVASTFLSDTRLNQMLLFSFKLQNPKHAELLENKGLTLFPATQTHSHPFSKMVENHMVFNCAYPLLKNMAVKGQLMIMSIKPSKADYLFRSNLNFDVINRMVTCKDHMRYDSAKALKDINSFEFTQSTFGKKMRGKNFFVYDEIHYWRETELRNFLELHRPKSVLCTIVYPPELLKGLKHSQNPTCYKFKCKGDRLIWAPDGNWSQSYEQPIDCPLLRCNKICVQDRTYSVELMESIFSHHLLLITEEGRPGKNYSYFTDFDTVDPTLFSCMHSFGNELVLQTRVFKKIFSYFASLKKPDLTSIEAKFRQLMNDDYEMAENFAVLEFFSSLIERGYKTGGKTFTGNFIDAIFLCLPDDVLRYSAEGTKLSNTRLLSLMEQLKIEVELGVYNISYEHTRENVMLSLDAEEGLTFHDEILRKEFEFLKVKNTREPEPFTITYEASSHRRTSRKRELYSGARCFSYCKTWRPYNYRAPMMIQSKFQAEWSGEVRQSIIADYYGSCVNYAFILEWGRSRSEDHANKYGVHYAVTDEDVDICDDEETDVGRSAPEEDLLNLAFIEQAATEDVDLSEFDFKAKVNFCLLRAISAALGEDLLNFCERLAEGNRLYWLSRFENDEPMGRFEIEAIVEHEPLSIFVHMSNSSSLPFLNTGYKGKARECHIYYDGTHYDTKHAGPSAGPLPAGKTLSSEQLLNGLLVQASIPKERLLKVKASKDKATFLLDELNKGSEGLIKSGDLDELKTRMVKLQDKELTVLPLVGFAGSGKSAPIQNALSRGGSKRICVVLPRRILADDWKRKCADNTSIMTYEVALLSKKKVDILIIDEVTLLPPGYVDLISYSMGANQMVLIGDPMQTEYHSEDSKVLSECSYDNFHFLAEHKVPYLFFSHRLPKNYGFIDVHTFGDEEFERHPIQDSVNSAIMLMASKGVKRSDITVLCAAREEKTTFARGYNLNCMTIGESQGLTFDNEVLIAVSPHLAKAGDRALYVALTRSRKGVIFFMSGAKDPKKLESIQAGCFLDRVLRRSDRVTPELFKRSMRFEFEYICDPLLGTDADYDIEKRDEVNREELLDGDKFLQSTIFLGQRLAVVEANPLEVQDTEVKIKTHLPLENEDLPLTENHEFLRAKEVREFREGMNCSDQFRDNPNPLCFEAIYPRHKMSDDVTFWAAVRKRLIFSDPDKEQRKLNKAHIMGQYLFDNFLKEVPLDREVNEQMLVEAQEDFERTKLKKSAATLAKHSSRSDPDLDIHQVMIFMKTQLCTKFEKRFCDAKAGQTLACFHHAILCYFSKWCRYVEKKLSAAIPKRFYIHQRKNFDELNLFIKENWVDGVALESDYEAFDASQDSNILSFELLILQHLNIPREVIENYRYLKLHLGSKLGNFAIMRFTGEFCTFLFNTMANMAFTFCRYKITSSAVIMFAGDDMCSSEPLELNRKNDWVFEKLTLKAKVQYTNEATFCGWRISSSGIAKQPKLVYERFCIAEERGNLSECLESYFLEMNYAYALGDKLLELFDQSALSYHYLLVRKFIKLSGELKGRAAKLVRQYLSNKEIFIS